MLLLIKESVYCLWCYATSRKLFSLFSVLCYLYSVICYLYSVLCWLYSIKFLTDPLPCGTPPNLEGEFLVSKLSSALACSQLSLLASPKLLSLGIVKVNFSSTLAYSQLSLFSVLCTLYSVICTLLSVICTLTQFLVPSLRGRLLRSLRHWRLLHSRCIRPRVFRILRRRCVCYALSRAASGQPLRCSS